MKLSEKIKKLRIKNKLTQEELASKLHVSRQTISKWEQEVTVPSLDTLKELASIFNVELIELIDDKSTTTYVEDKVRNKNRVMFLLNIFVVIVSILSGLILFRGMDDIIPVHYDFLFNITRYGKKVEYLVIPGITIIFLSFSIYFYYGLSKRVEYKKASFGYQISMLVLQLVILFFTIYLGFRYTSNVRVIPTITGLTLTIIHIVMLLSHPKINKTRNVILGVRTNFTLTNEVAWKNVNAFSSYIGSITTLIAYILTLITFDDWNQYLILVVMISIIPTLIYHEVLRKKFSKSETDQSKII